MYSLKKPQNKQRIKNQGSRQHNESLVFRTSTVSSYCSTVLLFLSRTAIEVCKLSPLVDEKCMLQEYKVGKTDDSHVTSNTLTPQPGQYLACIYDGRWYMGMAIGYDRENVCVNVRFMCKGSTNNFTWPQQDDICWVPQEHVLLAVAPPSTTNSGKHMHLKLQQLITLWNVS